MIESSIPMPPKRGRPCRYPWPGMAVGDSVFFPGQKASNKQIPKGSGNACASSKSYGHRNGKRFVARAVPGGCRIWRVE